MRLAQRTITELVAHESQLCALFTRRVRAFTIYSRSSHGIGKYHDITNSNFIKTSLVNFLAASLFAKEDITLFKGCIFKKFLLIT